MIAILIVTLLAFVSCAQLSELPPTAKDAFALPDRSTRSTQVETFIAGNDLAKAMDAAEYALDSVLFESRPESWTPERRCGEYTTGMYDWAMWGCFYFLPDSDGILKGRVVVESWNSFGVTTNKPWSVMLVSAFRNRMEMIAGTK